MSQSVVTKLAPDEIVQAERRRYAAFAVRHSEPVYREVLADLYDFWREMNKTFFRGQLKKPHLTIGVTPPRCLGFCKPLTDWGGQLQITISETVVLGRHRVVVNRWPAEGAKRFARDMLLHEILHQFAWEVSGDTEQGYRGHGPRFTKLCNEIGERLGITFVITRRRGRKDSEKATANYWPYSVRPAGYYAPDVDLERMIRKMAKPQHYTSCARCLANLLAFFEERGGNEFRNLLQREIEREQAKPAKGGSPAWIDIFEECFR